MHCRWRSARGTLLMGLAVSLAGAVLAWSAPPAGAAEPRLQTVGAHAIPRDVVAALAQDRAGFLWIATGDGVVRYDGHRFRVQERSTADPARRSLGWVTTMLAARDGRVWFGTEVDGLAVYDPATDRIVDHKDPALGAAPAPTITALAEDADGSLWVAAVGAGLQHFDPRTGQHRRQTLDIAADVQVHALLAAQDGSLWLGHARGLSRRASGSSRFEPVPGAPQEAVRALAQASDGRLWLGTQAGRLFVLDAAGGAPVPLQPLAPPPGGRPGAVSSLVEGADGLMWVGRSTGIDLHEVANGRARHALRHDLRRTQGLAGNEVTALLRDRAGAIWVAGIGIGLQRHDPTQDALSVVTPALPGDSLPAQSDLRQLLQHSDGSLWAADHEGRLWLMDDALRVRAVLPPRVVDGQPLRVTALHEAEDGQVWLGGEGMLVRVDRQGRVQRSLRHGGGTTHVVRSTADGTLWAGTRDGLLRWNLGGTRPTVTPAPLRMPLTGGRPLVGDVFAAVPAADGALWVGGVQGLFRVDPGQQALREVLGAAPGAGLASPVVIGLLLDRQQRLWVDTAVTGLHRLTAWDGTHARFERVSLRHGVQRRPFGASLLEDRQGRIWTHMHVHDPVRDTLHTLGAADGVRFGTGWFRAHAQAPDGRLFFGGSRGLLVVQPERFRQDAPAAPLRLTELRVNGERQQMPSPDGLRLTRRQRSVAVEFAVLDYGDPGRHRYAYRLDGFDPDWVAAGPETRVAAYSNLDPGRYTLRVRAGLREGSWNPEELVLPLRVLPAWWQRREVEALAAVGSLGLLWALLNWRTGRLRRQRRALEAAVAARTAELEAARNDLEGRVQARTAELATATAAAEAASRAKTAFLQSVSHEMRTPLNAILGLTYLAQAEAQTGPRRQQLGQVTNAAQQLLKLINEVLDRAQREAASGPPQAAVLRAAATDEAPANQPLPRFHGERILLAEDEAVNQIVATGILERAGLVVDRAENGAQALRMATSQPYALVLMDLQMPELDGLAATRAIRATAAGASLPIVALSAFAFDEDRRRCLEAGMNDHVSKPVVPADLLHAVRRWLRPPD